MIYDADYFERGIETGKSNFQNYRWLPELTIPMAMSIVDLLEIKRGEPVLDYGCAKGYLVKALRLLHRDAWGADISEYALRQADKDIARYLVNADILVKRWINKVPTHYKNVVCKDVLEHIPFIDLTFLLKNLDCEKLFAVIPLGNNGKYNAPANDRDATHIVCEPESWWLKLFRDCGWAPTFVSNRVDGIKDHYADIPNAHLFCVHRRSK